MSKSIREAFDSWADLMELSRKETIPIEDYTIPQTMMPIIRRAMPSIIANKLVTAQPIEELMEEPHDTIYYCRPIYREEAYEIDWEKRTSKWFRKSGDKIKYKASTEELE